MLHCAARVSITVLLLAVWTRCAGPTSSTDVSEGEIADLWAEGQQALLYINSQWQSAGEPPIRGDVRTVKHTKFLFVAHDGPLYLGGEQVGGYFEPGLRRIHYQEEMMNAAIPHEACHAILYELGDPRWHCVFHDECHP